MLPNDKFTYIVTDASSNWSGGLIGNGDRLWKFQYRHFDLLDTFSIDKKETTVVLVATLLSYFLESKANFDQKGLVIFTDNETCRYILTNANITNCTLKKCAVIFSYQNSKKYNFSIVNRISTKANYIADRLSRFSIDNVKLDLDNEVIDQNVVNSVLKNILDLLKMDYIRFLDSLDSITF